MATHDSKTLQTLSIAFSMLDDEQLIEQLTRAILEAASVRELALRACLTAPSLPKTLPPLLELMSTSSSLTFLDLTGNCLGDSGVESLATHGLAKTQVLRALVLDENSISDKGATQLGTCLRQHKQTSLQSMSLALNVIQKAGMQYLASALCSNSTLLLISAAFECGNFEIQYGQLNSVTCHQAVILG